MFTPRKSRTHAGFSLVEFLLVAFIFAIGLLGLAALMNMSTRSSGNARQRDTAAYLANDVLERLAVDGLRSAQLRLDSQVIPGTLLLANAVDDTANTYEADDTGGTAQTTFDMEGRPSGTNPVFAVEWVRRAPKGTVPVAASASMIAEVLVNVSWAEPGPGTGTTQKWLSFSRMIRY